jgi:hypothetical protein
MNKGAIAIANELLYQSSGAQRNMMLDWLENNVKKQVMYTNNSDITYIIGESELFDEPVFNGKYPVYHMLFDLQDRTDLKISVYKTVSKIYV